MTYGYLEHRNGNNSQPDFSVITITRNDATGLKKTIQSLSGQLNASFEHVVIDGASTDDTASVLTSYESNQRVIIVSEPDAGIYDAMNKGILKATGRLVVFMNSGDTFGSPGTLSFVKDEYDQGDWRWGFGCMRYVDESGARITGQVRAPFNKRKLILGTTFVPHQAMYMELSLLREIGPFRLDLGIAADQDMAIRAAVVSEPAVWIEFLTDFLVGGAHSTISRWEREYIYHRIRKSQNLLVSGNAVIDLAVTAAIAGSRITRDCLSWVVKRRAA